MKEFLKRNFPRPLLDYFHYWFYYKLFRRGFFAQSDIDKKLEKYLNYNDGFFVELGANDGFTASNTLRLEQKQNWHGILIEPSPNLFLSCTFYRAKKGNKIFCNACVPFGFQEKYVDIDYAYLMSISTNLESDIEDKQGFLDGAKHNFNDFQKNLKFGALAQTLTSILDKSDAPNLIDFLSLDVEGAELDVLKGVDFEKYNFKYMLIECRKIDRLSQFLKNYDYELIDKLSSQDYLFSFKQS